MNDDDEIEWISKTKLSISDDDLRKIMKEAKRKKIHVKERDYPSFERREVEIGDYRLGKWDLKSNVYTHFNIQHAEHEWHPEPEISVKDPAIKLIAKYARDGDFIEIEFWGSFRRWVFQKGKVKEIYPKVTYDWGK
jgi:hypothetical protein